MQTHALVYATLCLAVHLAGTFAAYWQNRHPHAFDAVTGFAIAAAWAASFMVSVALALKAGMPAQWALLAVIARLFAEWVAIQQLFGELALTQRVVQSVALHGSALAFWLAVAWGR